MATKKRFKMYATRWGTYTIDNTGTGETVADFATKKEAQAELKRLNNPEPVDWDAIRAQRAAEGPVVIRIGKRS